MDPKDLQIISNNSSNKTPDKKKDNKKKKDVFLLKQVTFNLKSAIEDFVGMEITKPLTGENATSFQLGPFGIMPQPEDEVRVKNISEYTENTFIVGKDARPEFESYPETQAQLHPYLKSKKIDPGFGERYFHDKVVIPVYNPQGDLISLQYIDPKNKKFKPKHPLGNGYHFPIGKLKGERVCACEGVATGWSINKMTKGCRVYCALSRQNLQALCEYLLLKYPNKTIVLCLDNDDNKAGTFKPTIKDERLVILKPDKPGDFNDHQDDPKEQAKLQFLSSVEITPMTDKKLQSKKSLGWAIPGWLPERGSIMLTGSKGSGKSYFCFLLSKLLTDKRSKENIFGKDLGGGRPWLYCYMEGDETQHRDRWQAMGGDPAKLDLWQYKPDREENWTNHKVLEKTLKTLKYGGVIIDRGDMLIGNKETKTAVRDAILRFDKLCRDCYIPGILTRHTSKPQGTEARQFTERTDGFKEWQHTPRVCLLIHKTEQGVIAMKQYANDTDTDGLIHLHWVKKPLNRDKTPSELVTLDFHSLEADITQNQIEKKYNPRGYAGGDSGADFDSRYIEIIKNQVEGKLKNDYRYLIADFYTWAKEILGLGKRPATKFFKLAGYTDFIGTEKQRFVKKSINTSTPAETKVP